MKIRNKKLVIIIGVFLFLITPFFGFVSFAKAQSTENSLIYGATLGVPKAWDPAISQADAMGYIKYSAIESLVWQNTKGVILPQLAESWTIHARPDGNSSLGLNQGGVAAIEFTLRENVTFHDGSAFNASVVKWNFDRLAQVSGYDNHQWYSGHWMNPATYRTRFTPDWDLTWAINDPEVSFIDLALNASITDGSYINYTAKTTDGVQDYYIYFDTTGANSTDPALAGRLPIYVNISSAPYRENVSKVLGTAIGAITEISASYTDNNVTITNVVDGDVTDIGGTTTGLTVSTVSDGIIRNTFGTINPELIPLFNSTDVISEFVVNVTFNKWFVGVDQFADFHGFISMESYGPWFNKSIDGYGAVPNAYDGTVFPGHMIGTGAYKFESVDFLVEAKAHSTKFENYWNRTALEAAGLFSVTDLYGRFFADATGRGNALLATDIDLVNSMMQDAAPISDAKASPYLEYYPTVPDASPNVIIMKSAEGINTPLAALGGQTIKEWFPTSTIATVNLGLANGTELPAGINKTVRKAASYSFDRAGYVSARYPATSGGGIYCWSPFGMSSQFTDDTVDRPGSDPDLPAARAILLADPYYAGLCAARGLSIANTTAEWEAVAQSNPIETFSYLTYQGGYPPDAFVVEAFNAIGFGVTVHEDATPGGGLWTQFIATGRAVMYDMQSYVYLMNPSDPSQYGPYWYASWAARLPYWGGYNYAHLMNGTVDSIFANIEFLTDKQASYNELADILVNKEVHSIFMSQGTMGMVLNAGFTVGPTATEVGGPASPGMSISQLGGSRSQATALPPGIPGYPTMFMVLTMMISIIGLIYVIKRKRK